MNYTFEYKPYNRKLVKPLRASYGEIWERNGFLIRLEDEEGRVGYGDVAPFEYFGTETLAQAGGVLNTLGGEIFEERIKHFPCVQFGLESARWMLEGNLDKIQGGKRDVVALLSGGRGAVDEIKAYLEKGYRHFKWKVSVELNEIGIFEELIKLAPKAKFRVDANGGLSEGDVWKRLEYEQIEFVEQPYPAGEEEEMKEFGDRVALDESTLRVEDMEKVEVMGWSGYVVVKPSLMGSVESFLKFREKSRMRFSYSSGFETLVGNAMGLALAATDVDALNLGYGVQSYFESDGYGSLNIENGQIDFNQLRDIDFKAIWNR